MKILAASKTYGVKVQLDRDALLKFEEIKRAGNPNAKGPARLKHSRFTLPLSGPALNHSDFWNVLVGYAYRQAGSADFKLVSNNTKEQIEALACTEEAKVTGKFTAKIEAATRKVAKIDLAHSEAEPGPAKEGLAVQLQALRDARDGLVTQRSAAKEEVEAKYAKMLEVRAEMDAQKQALIDKAKKARDALFTRKEAAGGASATDGAAALARVSGRGGGSTSADNAVRPARDSAEPEADEPAEVEAAAEEAAAAAEEAAEADEEDVNFDDL